MTNFLHPNLKARLTRSDRLARITALLQRVLPNTATVGPPLTSSSPAGAPARGAPEAFGAGFQKEALDWTQGTAQPAVPEALREFLDRIGQPGSLSGLPSKCPKPAGFGLRSGRLSLLQGAPKQKTGLK